MPVSHKESTPVDFKESAKADFLLNSSLSRLCREERCNYNIYIEFDEVLLFCLSHAHAKQKTQKSGYYALVLQLLRACTSGYCVFASLVTPRSYLNYRAFAPSVKRRSTGLWSLYAKPVSMFSARAFTLSETIQPSTVVV